MKGIILAGGSGTRLHPLTKITNKHLLPVFDKPMIYYPLSTLILGGIREIAIISSSEGINQYKELLGDGSTLGIEFTYFIQEKPKGIAEAFIICEDFIDSDNVVLILGDNIFHGNLRVSEIFDSFNGGALIFGYKVKNPQSYGVLDYNNEGDLIDIIEKPNNPTSDLAVPGLYLYDNRVIEISKNLSPSPRGELEITDVNREFLEKDLLSVQILGRGIAWLDVGTPSNLQIAGQFVSQIEERQGYKIGCIEEASLRSGFVDVANLANSLTHFPESDYKDYVKLVIEEFSNTRMREKIEKLQK